MDKIFLHGMQAETLIGVYEWERQQSQTLLIDLDLGIRKRCYADDKLDNTINYAAVAQAVRTHLAKQKFQLLETLAQSVIELLLQQFTLEWVKIRIIKQGILANIGEVGIEMERFATPDVENNLKAA